MENSKQFQIDLKKGIPDEVRGEVWSVLIGNEQRITRQLYAILIKRQKKAEEVV